MDETGIRVGVGRGVAPVDAPNILRSNLIKWRSRTCHIVGPISAGGVASLINI